MAVEMLTSQLFRIKGNDFGNGNLKITVTAFYEPPAPPSSAEIDLRNNTCVPPDGLTVIVGGNMLDVGRSFRSGVTGFQIEISDKAYEVGRLSLQYAICDAADAMKKDFYPDYRRLNCGTVRFTLDGERFLAEMRSAESEASAEADTVGTACTAEDIIGDIKADIRIVSYYMPSKDREELLNGLGSLLVRAEQQEDIRELRLEARELEKKINEYIETSADYFSGSRKHLYEKTAGKGR